MKGFKYDDTLPNVKVPHYLCTLLQNVIKVTDVLTRHLYTHGDKLLEDATPIALTVNEMYAITRRLQLPRDAHGIGTY